MKEGSILFNDALNTFCLRLYGVRDIVKDHSDSERGNSLPRHRLLFPIRRKGFFICIILLAKFRGGGNKSASDSVKWEEMRNY